MNFWKIVFKSLKHHRFSNGLAAFSIVVVGLANHWRFKNGRWMQIDLFKHAPKPATVPMEQGLDSA